MAPGNPRVGLGTGSSLGAETAVLILAPHRPTLGTKSTEIIDVVRGRTRVATRTLPSEGVEPP
jgi:hypothetical protein